LPFYSQQNKQTGKFLLDSCGTTKICDFIARRAFSELGWRVRVVLPDLRACEPYDREFLFDFAERKYVHIPADNLHQRLHWDVTAWRQAFGDCDIVLSFHEFAAWPLKNMFSTLRVVQFTGVPASAAWTWTRPLFHLSWRAADLNAVYSAPMARHIIDELTPLGTPSWKMKFPTPRVWPLAYDADVLRRNITMTGGTTSWRDIDVLFVPRASATNYSQHTEFIDAVKCLRARGWTGSVWFTDVTRYLRQSGALAGIDNVHIAPHPESQVEYVRLLCRSKVAVCLRANMYSMAAREAVACGAFPVYARDPGYGDILGSEWPFSPNGDDPESIADAVELAFSTHLWDGVDTARGLAIIQAVAAESFQQAWTTHVRADLLELSR
jgi:hypothetical protein